jgi:cytosine/adenosine deaminase-related metal-dependent hydrolase
MTCDLVIENAVVLTMDAAWNLHEPGFVAISGEDIVGVGPASGRISWESAKVMDGRGMLLMPGFVNTHTHIAMAAFRGACEDLPDRLVKYIFPLEKRLVNRELVGLASRFCLAEMAASGTTTFADMYYFEDEVARAAKEAGMRCLLGETVVDFPAPDAPEAYGGIGYGLRFIEEWKGDGLVTPCLAPHAPYTVDARRLILVRKESERRGLPVLMHIAETAPENARFTASHGSVIRYLDSLGFLFPGLVGAHMIYLDETDIALVAKSGMSVAHCPASNAKGGRPVCPASALMEAGVRLGLATDGPLSGNGMDMQGIVGLFPKMQKVRSGDREVMPARLAVRAATLGGAEALGLGAITGSIEKGKKADMILVDADDFNMQPVYDWYATVAYAMRPHNVDTVFVGGGIIWDRSGMRGFDARETLADMKRLAGTCRNAILEIQGGR